MLVVCTRCRHFRAPERIRPFEAEPSLSPGMIKAEREWMEQSDKRRAEEQRRFEGRLDFNYEPEFFAWCADRLPSAKKLRALSDMLLEGDKDGLKDAAEKKRFFADPSRGVVVPIYDLCAIRNADGKCGDFEAPEPAPDAPEAP